MNDRNVSRVKALNGYTTGFKGGFKDARSYKGHSGPGAALIAANQPKKKTVRPVQLSSLKSESTDTTSFTTTTNSSSGWGNAKKDIQPKSTEQRPTGTQGQAQGTQRPWSSGARGVPGLNQPEPQRKELTSLGSSSTSRQNGKNDENVAPNEKVEKKSQVQSEPPRKLNPMLPTYMKPVQSTIEAKKESSDESQASEQNGMQQDEANLDWADDKPMDWSEKIIFSDDDQSAKSATPVPQEQQQSTTQEAENGYDNRYDNYDRNKGRSYNTRYYDNHYDNRSNRSNYRNPQSQMQQGFYDDHERQFYAADLENKSNHRDENLFSRSQQQQQRNRRASTRSQEVPDAVADHSPVEMMITNDQEQEAPKRKIVVRRSHKALRDFTNEEKGEDGIDEIEQAENLEKDKTIRPRGWKQNNDDQPEQQKSEQKKKEAEKKKTRKEKSQQRGGDHNNKDVKMPTADGSRMSKLDKENAEKEIKNKNVWAERQQAQRQKSKTDDSETFVPSKEDGKKMLGQTNPGSREIRSRDSRDTHRANKETRKESRDHHNNPRNENKSSSKNEKKTEKKKRREKEEEQQPPQREKENVQKEKENTQEKKPEFVEAKPPSTNFWEGRIKQQQQQQKEITKDESDQDRHKRSYDRDQPRHKSERSDRNKNDRADRRRIRSRDLHPSDHESHGSLSSKGSLQKFREAQQQSNNRKRQNNDRPSNDNQQSSSREKQRHEKHPEKKVRRKDEGRKKESGSSTEDIRHGHHHQRGSTTARKSTMDRGGKRRNNGDSRQTRKNDRFKNAYEFPKPNQDDIKDAQVPNVEAIRGGLSFRGLMRQRGSMRSTRQRSSDQSKSEESYDDSAPVESETIDATQHADDPIEQHESNDKEDSKLNANAADFIITPKPQLFESSDQNQQSQQQQQQPQISFIAAMPSPQPAPPQRQGIYGDTTSNSPKLGQSRIDETNSNSPINVDDPINPSTLKKMELSRKAWDNAPSSRQAPSLVPQANVTPNKEETKTGQSTVPQQQTSSSMANQEFEASQPINTESNSWQQPNEQWSNGKSSQNIPDAWSSNNKPDNWKKNEMVPTPTMNDMSQNQLHGLNQPINQIGFRSASGMNHIDQITQMNLLGSYNQSGAQAAASAGQQASALQAAQQQQQQQNYQNAFNGFSYSNQQVYPSAAAAAQLIAPNQISNFEFGGQQYLNSTNPSGNSSFNSNLYANEAQRLSDFGFNSHAAAANNMMYSAFDQSNQMLANLQRQNNANNVNLFPQAASNGITNRYQNIQSNAFNALNMANQQQANQRPDLNNIRTSIGQPHHAMQSSNIFGKSPSPSNPSIAQKLMNPGFNDFNSFNQSGAAAAAAVSNQAAFRLNQSKPGRPNSSTPPHGHHHHHHRKNNRDFAFMNSGRGGFDSSFDSQNSYMSGKSEVFDPKMNQYGQFNRNQSNQPQINQFDQSNYFKQSASFTGGNSNSGGGGGAGGNNFSMTNQNSAFMNNSGRNSRNGGLPGNPGNNQNLSSNGAHMNMRGVIGTNFNDKKFGSVGSKLDQKMAMEKPNGQPRGSGQVKKKDNFQLSQKEKNDSQQALIGKVAEMTTNTLPNKFGALSLDKNGSGDNGTLSETPETPTGQEMTLEGEEKPTSAENIVLNVEDRKRLTLADTAPKGGGIRRIITTDRS